MALYKTITSWMSVSEMCKIVKTEQGDGFTLYVLEVTIPPFSWTVHHRYSDFRDLNDKLTSLYHIDKSILPPKKLFGNQSDAFIQKRQADLELYLHTIIHQLPNIPSPIAHFLGFPQYEVRGIIDNLAEALYFHGDQLLTTDKEFLMTPLQLHALSERLALPEPTCASGDKKRDLGHIMDFASRLQKLTVEGSEKPVGLSNIIPNQLNFGLTPFKSLQVLRIKNCKLKNNLKDLATVQKILQKLVVHNSLDELTSMLLGDVVHWSPLDSPTFWPRWNSLVIADFSHNLIEKIDPSIKLLSAVEMLDLSYNCIGTIENLESLPHLSNLNLSHNKLCLLDSLHTRLGNVRTLSLAGNVIYTLQGFARLYSLVELDLGHNQVAYLKEVGNLVGLPVLEKLNLVGNPVTTVVDYRPHTLVLFGARASELILDGERVSQKEVDTVAVLQALQAAREGRILHQSSSPHTYRSRELGTVPTLAEHGRTEQGACTEFRQQVAALRRLGGSDWLRLLNQLQQEKLNTKEDTAKKREEPQSLEMELPLHCTDSCSFAKLENYSGILLPDWLTDMGLATENLRDVFAAFLLNEERIVSLMWAIVIVGHGASCNQWPACMLLTESRIVVLRITALLCEHEQSLPLPEFGTPLSISSLNVKCVYSGPFDSYVELHHASPSGLQRVIVLAVTDVARHLGSLYQLNIEEKYSDGEFEESVKTAALVHGSARYFGVLYCTRVCLAQMDNTGTPAQGPHVICYLLVTPSQVLMLEEALFPHTSAPRVLLVTDVRTDLHNFQMKDNGRTNHVCCCHSGISDGRTPNCCLMHELHSCGYWLLMNFEGTNPLHVRFANREGRSHFLEAFLSARNHT